MCNPAHAIQIRPGPRPECNQYQIRVEIERHVLASAGVRKGVVIGFSQLYDLAKNAMGRSE
jgi:hypothetical protein